jgi:hypothetical protein
VCFGDLIGAFLLERLACLFRQVLSRRLVGHGCSLVGSLVSPAGLDSTPPRVDDAWAWQHGARHST